ncbi:neutral/alkaline non-lysosomal ceramidase N-terminal domain-containing protein [Dyadobacter subterraneus]|uniref:Neutral/alkaline non-lysosomal ceramidase N-terminal domain-containing protein n=1 Tax=Dyadobacter subterraneus TaxID=2773304 RepID=A0ABR9W7R2_9BACT|nr:neutral/alkaline non-lysosomal ceramidase N-terminal domain-containing protein [Dyadobacter subterraneus]MBE9461504.1 neutral/alkaline non-lysosomal ceramidase N-terminal domain-containing protein [Dyadobacter subterraneus]
MKVIFFLTTLAWLVFPVQSHGQNKVLANDKKGWKAGVAKVVITPAQSMWMAGFASRTGPSEGKLHDLWAKALALEDADGQRSVLVTMDLLGLPKMISDTIRKAIENHYHLSKAQIILNASHTHSGPVLSTALSDIYPTNQDDEKKIQSNSIHLTEQIINLVGSAIKNLAPASLFAQNGVARFQVNRRNNDAAKLETLTALVGPSDPAVPVIKVTDTKGNIIAIAFGYACHPTVLNENQWSGDYPGYAQIELEKLYPKATALFFQGAGADQNPLPRNTVPLAVQYGKTLAAAVERVLSEDMKSLEAKLTTAYNEIDLSLTTAPSEEKLTKMAEKETGFQQRWAKRMLEKIKNGQPFQTTYPYPVQIWKLGEQPIMTLGGELVSEYAINLKRIFGQSTFVMGYCNDVVSYIPTSTILREGGYEGDLAQIVYGLPATWASDTETKIMNGMIQLAEKAGVVKPESQLIK